MFAFRRGASDRGKSTRMFPNEIIKTAMPADDVHRNCSNTDEIIKAPIGSQTMQYEAFAGPTLRSN
jgi:hypothetical protein